MKSWFGRIKWPNFLSVPGVSKFSTEEETRKKWNLKLKKDKPHLETYSEIKATLSMISIVPFSVDLLKIGGPVLDETV